MDRVKTRSLWLAILLGALLMTPTPQAWAQANELPEGWEIQLIPMWMWVKGFDEHMGDTFIDVDTFDGSDFFTHTRDFKPINLEMESNITGRAELTFRRNQWGFGVSSWFFYTDDDLTGTVVGRSPIAGDPGTTFEAAISMWGDDFFPLDDLDPSGSPPIGWFADAELDTFTADIFVLRTLAEKPASRIDLLAGVKLGWLDMELNQGFAFREFNIDGGATSAHSLTFTARRSDTDADFLGIGPMVGFAGDATFEQIRIKGFITQSVLAGEAEWDGVQRASRRQLSTDDSSGGGPFLEDFLDTFDRPFDKEETVFIPVTEAQIKVKYEITENIALGLAGFASIWYDAPAPPRFDDAENLWVL
ncbi:MAG: hypothetical protein IH975_11100, partial [Nitrospinae bacterium]|nr:hypothetical protein [Nitrospinota bacterium]